MDVRHLTDADVPAAGIAFTSSLGGPVPKEPERYGRYWDVSRSVGAFDEAGVLLGVAATFRSRFTAVGGAPLSCYTVPSVGVRPDRQGMGAGRAMLERQVADAVEDGAQVMALNASETGIYGRYGYGPTSAWWSVEVATRSLRFLDGAPRATPGSITELTIDEATELLPALHRRCFGLWAGELERPANMWAIHLVPRPGKELPIFALLRGDDGEPAAMAAYTVTQAFDEVSFANVVEVVDIFGIDDRHEALLARWLCERPLAGTVKAERWNPRSVLTLLLDDPRAFRTTVMTDSVWVRVLDVAAVVSARTTLATGTVHVALEDRLVPANTRTWTITGDGASLTCEVAGADVTADVTMDVRHLATILWGFERASSLAAAGLIGVSAPDSLTVLDRLMAVDGPSWCSVGF